MLILPTPREILVLVIVAMALENVLFPMLEQLDRAERMHVRKLLGGEELQLFTILIKKINHSPLQVRAAFAHLGDAGFATLRTRLQDSIAIALGEYHSRKLPENHVQAATYAADALMNKREPEQAQRYLAKAIKLAIAHEVFSHTPHMYGLRNRLPHFLVGNKLAAKKWLPIDDMIASLYQCEKDFEARRQWLNHAIELNRGEVLGRRTKVEQLRTQLPEIDLQLYSRSNLLLARTHWICAWHLGEQARLEELVDWATSWQENEASILSGWETFNVIEAAYFLKTVLLAERQQFQDALVLLDQFEARCRSMRRHHLPNLVDIRWYVRGRELLVTASPTMLKTGLKTLLKEIGSPKAVGKNLFSLCIHVTEHCIRSNQFEIARPWLGLLGRAKMETRRMERAISAFVVELAFWHKAGQLDDLENCIRRLEYFAQTRPSDPGFVAIVVTGFRSLLRSYPSQGKEIAIFGNALTQYENPEQLMVYMSYFDLHAFLAAPSTNPANS